MAKNFGSANSAKLIQNVAKANNEKANVIQVKMVSNDNLVDFSRNHEDLDNTADLENSMRELGFTDPIEVTAYGMEEGKYTIVSGHRRRVAGVRFGMGTFPCIIKSFDNEHDVRNYVLLANSQRDSTKDPLLFCKRYKMHEEYLREGDFKGSVREEIAKRLGISSQQADRYNQFNKIILSVWDMVRDDAVGMSSVLPMATHSLEEQEEILTLLNECVAQGGRLTRETCDKIIKGYRDGKRTYVEITAEAGKKEIPVIRDSGLTLNGFINTEPSETKGATPLNRNGEMRREFDPVNYDDGKDPYAAERLTEDDYKAIEAVSKSNKGNDKDRDKEKEKLPPLTEDEKKAKRGESIGKHLEALEKCFNEFYTFEDGEKAELTMRSMCGVAKTMFDELSRMGGDYNKDGVLKELMVDLSQSLKQYE